MRFVETRREGDFGKLYKRLKPGLLYNAANILKDKDAAEDVISIAFEKIWTKVDQYQPYWKFSTWAYKIVYNECMQYLRKKKDTFYLLPSFEAAVSDTDGFNYDSIYPSLVTEPKWEIDSTEDLTDVIFNIVKAEINNLPGSYKDIMIDREIGEMKYQDIATKYSIKINSVKTRIRRARTMLKARVEEITGQKIQLRDEED
jgi:RNA polymerase sigma-70 factor (ECF subfamily)